MFTPQNAQFLVHTSPMIKKVAVRDEKHSIRLGHLALSHTVCKPRVRRMLVTSLRFLPERMGRRNQRGMRCG